MTVISILELNIRPDKLAEAPTVAAEVLKATRAREGNLGVEVTIDSKDETHYVIIERWESMAHDDAYRAWRATPDGASSLGELLAAPPVLTRCELDENI